MYKLVIFDLDGTLANTLTDLADATNFGLMQAGLPTHPVEKYNHFLGNGADNLVKRAMSPVVDEKIFKIVKESFNEYYSKHSIDKTTAYSGTEELLKSLADKNIKTAVLSNKPDEFVEEILSKLFPHHKFMCAWGKKAEYNIKPDPEAVFAIMKMAGAEKHECIYVGDSDVDCYTAQNAGIKCCGVSWGFRGKEELQSAGADVVIDRAEEFLLEFDI